MVVWMTRPPPDWGNPERFTYVAAVLGENVDIGVRALRQLRDEGLPELGWVAGHRHRDTRAQCRPPSGPELVAFARKCG